MLLNLAAMAMAASPGIMGDSTAEAISNATVTNATVAASSSGPAMDDQLNALVGGFSSPILSWILRYLHIDSRLLIPILGTISFITFAWQYIEQHALNQLDWFMCTVQLRPEDEIYAIMSSWIAAQPFAQKSKSFVVNSSSFNSRRLWDPCWWWDQDKEDEEDVKEKRNLFFTPAPGNHYFWYNRRLLIFRRQCNREGAGYMSATEREEISLSCFGRDPWVLKKLLHDAYTEYNGKEDNKTLIYRGVMKHTWGVATWQKSISKISRPFDTVILNETQKKEIVQDIEDYISPKTRRWYANRGIPYRRGYLLYGPPGTGKSSLSLALAGYFKMRIYIVSLSSVVAGEENLSSLFADLPRKCIVLLEDIDTAGLTHTRENDDESEAEGGDDDDRRGSSRRRKGQKEGRLSLSGLLNILDGVASQEGRILIMTTNHVDKLDKALIRPGRVDMQIKFSLADKEITTAIFQSMYGQFDNEQKKANAKRLRLPPGQPGATFGPESDSESEPEDVKQQREAELKAKIDKEKLRIEKLAKQFAEKVPVDKFSPAELQGYLLRHKCTPEKAIEGVEQWCKDTIKEREEKEKKEAEEKKKREEKRLLRKEKRRLRDAKKLKKLKAKGGNAGSDDSDNAAASDASVSDSGSESDDDKPRLRRAKSIKSRKARDDSESEQSDASSSEEEEKKPRKKKSSSSKAAKKSKRRKQESESESGDGSSSEEEEPRRKKKSSKGKGKRKIAREDTTASSSAKSEKGSAAAAAATTQEAAATPKAKTEVGNGVEEPKVDVEKSEDDRTSEEAKKMGDEPQLREAVVKNLLSPSKESAKGGELDSGYETPSEEGSVSGKAATTPSSASPLRESEVVV